MAVNSPLQPTSSRLHERNESTPSLWFHIGQIVDNLKFHQTPTGGWCSGGLGKVSEVLPGGRAVKLQCQKCMGEAREEV